MLRRYAAGHALLADLLIEQAEQEGLRPDELKRGLRALSDRFDRLLAAIGGEYQREADRPLDRAARRAERIEGVLAGRPADHAAFASEFGYRLDAHHLGLLVAGPVAAQALRDLAISLDRRLLVVDREPELLWAWLGGRRPFDPEELASATVAEWPAGLFLAIGEPGEGLSGWRLSHRQAAAALPIAMRGEERVVRYADVALLASILHDDVLATSLRRLYLDPLERERDGGRALRQTLRAYFATGRNTSSTAAALGVKRHTVTNRLRAIEAMIGRSLIGCGAEIELALRLDGLGSCQAPHPAHTVV